MRTVGLVEAKRKLSKLVDRALLASKSESLGEEGSQPPSLLVV
ncbi:MAG: hypothetical protein JWQ87_4335 [Candidatus Sulfotelmatobacter sp.]|nr:hypothetical protein [Candidatus Sulfotelmatobacter sp.]